MVLKLVNKVTEAKDTVSFFFESSEKFEFQAGQYLYLTIPELKYEDERGNVRHFTISSSPTERLIQVTTRIRQTSGYKKTLNELEIGTKLEARAPFGTFVFPQNENFKFKHIFFAGGIGITPFRSIIKYNIDQKFDIPMYLVYSNSDSDFIFKKELDQWANENKNIKIEYIDTSLVGRINNQKVDDVIKKHNLDIKNCIFYAVGPNSFVDAMEELVPDIITEKFTGY